MPHLCLGLARDLTAAGDAFVVGDVFVVVMVVVISAAVISVVGASFAENVEFNDMVFEFIEAIMVSKWDWLLVECVENFCRNRKNNCLILVV